jgi:hypothetical protein
MTLVIFVSFNPLESDLKFTGKNRLEAEKTSGAFEGRIRA